MKIITLLAILILAGAASAATVSWEDLHVLVLDKQVVVRDSDGVSTRAVVRGINDSEIILVRPSGEALTIPRSKVNRVQLWSRGAGATKGLLWGAAVGAVVFGIGAANCVRNEGRSEEAAGIALLFASGTAMFAGAGGGVGAVAGGVSTVYQAPHASEVKARRGFEPPFRQAKTQRTFVPPRSSSPFGFDSGSVASRRVTLPIYLAPSNASR